MKWSGASDIQATMVTHTVGQRQMEEGIYSISYKLNNKKSPNLDIFWTFFGGVGGVGSNRRNALNGISSSIWFDYRAQKNPTNGIQLKNVLWWRGVGSNHRPSDYEPDELPLLYPATCLHIV